MAKLPEIQQREVSLPEGRGPGDAVARANQIANITQTITKTAFQLAEINTDFKKTDAKVDAMNEIAAFEQVHAGKEVYTAEELAEMGVDDRVSMLDEDNNPRETVPRHEVYPILLEEQLNRSIDAHTGDIRNPKARKEWLTDMEGIRTRVLTDAVTKSKDEAVAYTLQQRVNKITIAQKAGNYAGAAELIKETYTNPAERDEALRENSVKSLDHNYNLMKMNATPDQLRAAADELAAKKLGDLPYDSDERTAEVNALRTSADKKESDLKVQSGKLEKEARGAAISAMTERVNSGEVLTWAKDFQPILTNEWAQDAAFANNLDRLWQNYQASGGVSVFRKEPDTQYLSDMRRRIRDPNESTAALERDLQKNMGRLDETAYHELDKAIIDRTNPVKQPGIQTVNTLTDSRLRRLGINPDQVDSDNDPAAIQIKAGFETMVNNAILAKKQREGGRELDELEIRDVVDGVFGQVKKREIEINWGRDIKGDNVFDAVRNGEKDNYATAITWMERRMALDPRTKYTPDDYWRAYLAYRETK